MTFGKFDAAALAALAPPRDPEPRTTGTLLERLLADAQAENARLSAAYNCLRSALAIHAGDTPSRQALDRAEKIRRGQW